MTQAKFSSCTMQKLVKTLSSETGLEIFSAALSKAGLPGEWTNPVHFVALGARQCELKITIGG